MSQPRYLAALAFGAFLWIGLFLAFTLAIDPYGVSPIRMSWRGVNQYKPKRLNIDRLLKPYEVWRYQPRTVFLGTSRINQSIDPSVLDETSYAPAYNASIPANSVALTASHLRQYIELDPNLRTVVVELFFYQFIGDAQEDDKDRKTFSDFTGNALDLLFSADALWASVETVTYNVTRNIPTSEIKPGGYLYFPPGRRDPRSNFEGFAPHIWTMSRSSLFPTLSQEALKDFEKIVQISREHDLELLFVLTPSHAYDDYRLESTGIWPLVEQWLKRVSASAMVYSFSQPNEWVYEPVKVQMTYWRDPLHFTPELGRHMQRALIGGKVEDAPANFMVRIYPHVVAEHIATRREAVKRWAKENAGFVEQFQEARRQWEKVHGSSN
ncbi:MAG: hypothetical protein ABI728_11045 [Betaproteobacteria bacterium]